MSIDASIRDTISRSGLARTLFVEAGAGTGKTTALVERIANLVLVEGVRLANIAAITFTDAAASELRDRVRLRFERELAGSPDALLGSRASQALAESDLAAISTLHAFAQRILAEHPAQSGLPPRIGVLDEVASTIEREERWERFVDRLHDDPGNEALLERAALLGIVIEPSRVGQASIKDIAARLDESWDRLDSVAALEHPPLPPVDFASFDRAVDQLRAVAAGCSDDTDKLYCRIVELLLPQMEAVVAVTDPSDKLRLLARAEKGWGPGSGGRAAAWGGDAGIARAAVAGVVDARRDIVEGACHEVLVRLTTLVARDLLDAAEARRAEGRLEFHDLLVFAKRLLERSQAARAALHARYTHLLLDEFQDTDPLQIHLAVLIAASVTGAAPEHWAHAEVPDGRLFFVGDPKQSIYRFRRADIDLFLAARDRFGADDALQRLSANFRTVEPIIAWVNTIFGELMADEVPGMQPAYVPLHAERSAPAGVDARPVLLGGPHHRTPAAEVRAAEADDVAEVVAAIAAEPSAWPVADAAAGGWRPARLADVTVLIPTRTELSALEAALRDRNVPYHLATGTLVFETQEVRDTLAVLAAVADPSDELAVVAALRSPLYGCSDIDLFTFHAAGGRWDLQHRAPDQLEPHHPVVEAMTHLRGLWEQRWWESASSLLARVVRERHAAVVAFGTDRPAEAWNHLRFLLDQARSFEESGGGDLRHFLDWAELQRSETVTVHQPVPADGTTDAVSIMTVHGAKGLEFPITILSGMSARPQPAVRGASVIWDPDGLPGVALRQGVATGNHGDLRDTEREMAAHERTRLLYVAATRARDHLVASVHHQEGNRSFAHQMWTVAEAHPDTWRRPERRTVVVDTPSEQPPRPEPEVPSAEERAAWRADRQAMITRQGARRVISATELARTLAGGSTEGPDGLPGPDPDVHPDDLLDEVSSPEGPRPVTVGRRRGRAGTAIGRAVHATLQLVDLHDPSGVGAEAARQAHIEAIPEHTVTVEAMARSALASPTVRAAQRYHREVYVAAPIGGRLVEGYVDLLVETPEGLVVVDYKTDTVRSEADIDEKLAAYELQGAAYAAALEVSTGLPVVSCRFVFCRTTGAVEREVVDLRGAIERVRRHADGTA